MATLIQKKAGIVNLIETTFAGGQTIIGTFSLDCVAEPVNKPAPEISLVQILDCNGKPNRVVEFTPTLEVQDEGGAAIPFVGTMDDLINKLNSEYFISAAGGGGGSSDTTKANQDIQIANQDTQISHSEKLLIGSTIDLTLDDGAEWAGYPFTLFSSLAIRIEVDGIEHSFTSAAVISQIEDLIEELQNKQNLLSFSKNTDTSLLVNDGTKTVDSTSSFELLAMSGEFSYPNPSLSWAELTTESLSAIQDLNERSKQILAYISALKDGQILNKISEANSTKALLGSGGFFVGEWENVTDYTTLAVTINGSAPTDGVLLIEVSQDGGTTNRAIPFLIENASTDIPHIWNIVESHARISYGNGLTPQTGSFQMQTKYSNGQQLGLLQEVGEPINVHSNVQLMKSVVSGEILDGNLGQTGIFGNVSLLENKALKTAIPPTVLYEASRPTDPEIPTGAPVIIDLVLNTEANVLDSGWLPVKSFGGGVFFNAITDTSLQIYLLNSSDVIGSNIVGNQGPVMTTIPGSAAPFGSPFFDGYFRCITINVSGAPASEFSIRAVGQQTPAAPVFNALNQPIAGFFPAPITRSVLSGEDPEGIYHNVNVTRNGDLANAITDADLGFRAIVTPGGGLKTVEQTHLLGAAFGNSALNTTKWSISTVGSGTQDATGPGELSMDTGVTANSAVLIQSSDLARFIPANYNTSHHAITIPDGAAYAANNSRKWGAFNPVDVNCDGPFYEIDSGDWYVGHCKDGVVTRVIIGSWNGAGASTFPINSVSANVFEIEYNAGSIIYRVNGAVMHREVLLGSPYATDINFPVGMYNVNKNGSTTNVSLKLRAASIYTLGKGKGTLRPQYITGQTGGTLIKTGPGHLGKVVFSRTGNGSGDAEVLVYDGLSAVNQVGRVAIGGDAVTEINYDFTFNIGLFIIITGNGTLGTTIIFD